MVSLSERRGTNCTDAEWNELLEMGIVSSNETPTEWMNRIWTRLQYFRENDLLPTNSKKYFEARKLITYWSEVNEFYKSYAPEIGNIDIVNQEIQTLDTNIYKCDHEDEINH